MERRSSQGRAKPLATALVAAISVPLLAACGITGATGTTGVPGSSLAADSDPAAAENAAGNQPNPGDGADSANAHEGTGWAPGLIPPGGLGKLLKPVPNPEAPVSPEAEPAPSADPGAGAGAGSPSAQQAQGSRPAEPASLADATVMPRYAPLPPGTAIDIASQAPVPGEYFNYQICTVAYSFSTVDGRDFAVTASHCGKEGDLVWAGNSDNRFTFPSEPVGRVIYSDLYSGDTSNLDVALIEITGQASYYTPHPMETAVATRMETLPDTVCKVGRITGQTCGKLTHEASLGQLNADGERLRTEAARAEVCARTGDSGGPVYADIDGRQVIVGLVSGTTRRLLEGETCDNAAPMELSFTPITSVQRLVEQRVGPVALLSPAESGTG